MTRAMLALHCVKSVKIEFFLAQIPENTVCAHCPNYIFPVVLIEFRFVSHYFIPVAGLKLATLLKSDSDASAFLWNF